MATNTYFKDRDEHLDKVSETFGAGHIAENFSKYVSRQEITRFLFRHDLFKQVLPIKGSIVECGVFTGQGLMTWYQLSSVLEPVAFNRQIFGFDTFAGFPQVHAKDAGEYARRPRKGDVCANTYEELSRTVEIQNQNLLLPQSSKVSLIKGDFLKTSKVFLKTNPHLLISLLYLDFDIYEPTRAALKLFLPRMPKGAIIGFDEVNNRKWPGETLAVIEELELSRYRIQKFPYEPHMSYVVLGD